MAQLPFLALILVGVHSRIVGGVDASPGQWPYQVILLYNADPVCGASLISANWVLSAAHCFPIEHLVTDYTANIGVYQLAMNEPNVQSIKVVEARKNPSYSENSFSADLALVRLATPVTFTEAVKPVTLPSANMQFPVGMKCMVTGWGGIQHGVSLQPPKTLQVGEVALMSRRTCNCLYHINPASDTRTIQQDMICAGSASGSVDACQGDSGGPLSCYASGEWYQAGVISWGDECGAKNRPGVYILVSIYSSWIKENVPDAKVQYASVDITPANENESGCVGADGSFNPNPNGASVFIVTLTTLPLYWLTAYLLSSY
ncbi:LOW QUALITY PROTEIN: prostasin [Rhinophrynus dorsalis]